ncbi:SDR family NAD(P)-dependent oxidoreductase [Actinoplanes auranticolor]|uniref:Short-chain dehydrogenase n=1 Tax=Actinoplanes auranticolor TaxID=47988 RepID=A0A919SPJ7_9ACTN|nr:SDR family oxidoreductase [Actinoplanes auranticolor]GIM76635.1 short-chain dehydrogenase [Actinoplanes auranticolor]
MTEFAGLTAIVTGAASGIGAATATLLRERGARVAGLDLVAQDADLSVVCDVGNSASVDAAVATVAERFGRIDILINNAGIGAVGDVTANTDDEWHHVLNINVVGIARMSRAALPYLLASPSGAIVNTCSIAAPIGLPQRALYSASKGAVASLTLAMAADHVRQGVRVNAVVPGTADTPWVGRLLDAAEDPAAAAAALRGRQPTGRLVTAAEVAHAIAYLASPLASATTGTLLTVDGGMTGIRLPS